MSNEANGDNATLTLTNVDGGIEKDSSKDGPSSRDILRSKASIVPPSGSYAEKLDEYQSILHTAQSCPLFLKDGASLTQALEAVRQSYTLYHHFVSDIDAEPLLLFLNSPHEKVRIEAFRHLNHLLPIITTQPPTYTTLKSILITALPKTLSTNLSSSPSEAAAIMTATHYLLRKHTADFLTTLFSPANITAHKTLLWLADKLSELTTNPHSPAQGIALKTAVTTHLHATLAIVCPQPTSHEATLSFALTLLRLWDRLTCHASPASLVALDEWIALSADVGEPVTAVRAGIPSSPPSSVANDQSEPCPSRKRQSSHALVEATDSEKDAGPIHKRLQRSDSALPFSPTTPSSQSTIIHPYPHPHPHPNTTTNTNLPNHTISPPPLPSSKDRPIEDHPPARHSPAPPSPATPRLPIDDAPHDGTAKSLLTLPSPSPGANASAGASPHAGRNFDTGFPRRGRRSARGYGGRGNAGAGAEWSGRRGRGRDSRAVRRAGTGGFRNRTWRRDERGRMVGGGS
ncbi:MAG: hypothetical protein M1833_001407 [Piccolia ochrophora]|nr:MAG: hypothetical protein M1833_001407 [Piccolia ochrophora]